MSNSGEKQTGDKEHGGFQRTPLYTKMTMLMYIIVFLYSGCYWIQIGVLPVSRL